MSNKESSPWRTEYQDVYEHALRHCYVIRSFMKKWVAYEQDEESKVTLNGEL